MLHFKDDECEVCSYCGEVIEPGRHYLRHNGQAFCDEGCLKEYLLDKCKYSEEYIMTADDYAGNYADDVNDSMCFT